MRTLQQIKSDFEQILSEVMRINGVSVESAVQVSTVILQEFGKYSRCPTEAETENGNEEKPISEKQAKFLRDLGVKELPKTSNEASRKITELKGSGKGGFPVRSPFPK